MKAHSTISFFSISTYRDAGWSHLFANLMKYAMTKCRKWQMLLSALRELVQFLRNESYRKHAAQHLKTLVPSAAKILASFNASFAKWRYETLAQVMETLLAYSDICRMLPRIQDSFKRLHDPQSFKLVLEACGWPELWAFLNVWSECILKPLEEARRWGLVCSCCSPVNRLAKNAKRPQASRRLAEARDRISALLHHLEQTRIHLDLMMCSGFQWLFEDVCSALTALIAMMMVKFAWLSQIPYKFVNADNQLCALELTEQVLRTPDAELVSVSLSWKLDHSESISQVAKGFFRLNCKCFRGDL